MALPISKLIKAVKLQPGEPFTLPPGATLLASSNVGSITSTCDIPDLEQLECYFVVLPRALEGGDSANNLEMTSVDGIQVGKVRYPFSSGVQISTEADAIHFPTGIDQYLISMQNGRLKGEIEQTSIGNILMDLCADVEMGEGSAIYLSFITAPSVAEQMSFYGHGNIHLSGDDGLTDAPMVFPVISRNDIGDLPNSDKILTKCPCTTDSNT